MSQDYRDPIGASLTGQACGGERPIASRPRALALIEEPDVRMERGQAASAGLTPVTIWRLAARILLTPT